MNSVTASYSSQTHRYNLLSLSKLCDKIINNLIVSFHAILNSKTSNRFYK